MKASKELKGRPMLPERDLTYLNLKIPRPLRARLHERAKLATKENSLGLTITSRALAVEILDEGLTRREKAAEKTS